MKCKDNCVSVVCKGQALRVASEKIFLFVPLSLHKKSIFPSQTLTNCLNSVSLDGHSFSFLFFGFSFVEKIIIRRRRKGKSLLNTDCSQNRKSASLRHPVQLWFDLHHLYIDDEQNDAKSGNTFLIY